jgi:hypothetical protein
MSKYRHICKYLKILNFRLKLVQYHKILVRNCTFSALRFEPPKSIH